MSVGRSQIVLPKISLVLRVATEKNMKIMMQYKKRAEDVKSSRQAGIRTRDRGVLAYCLVTFGSRGDSTRPPFCLQLRHPDPKPNLAGSKGVELMMFIHFHASFVGDLDRNATRRGSVGPARPGPAGPTRPK